MREEPEKPFGEDAPPPSGTAAEPPSPTAAPEPDEEHRMSVDSDYYPATIPEESEDDLKLLERDEPGGGGDAGLPRELEPKQLAKLHDLKESNA